MANYEIARVMDKDVYEAEKGSKLPIKWTAPGAVLYKFTIKSDVWSFGILLYEIITYGCFPYPGIRNAQVLERVLQSYPMPQPIGCPDKFYGIMLHCWQDKPANRPTFETVTPVAIKRSLHPTLTFLLCQSRYHIMHMNVNS